MKRLKSNNKAYINDCNIVSVNEAMPGKGEVECLKCGSCFAMSKHIAGECSQCGNAYWWSEHGWLYWEEQ